VDDELPHRIEVKLAGALIRIFEYAGAYRSISTEPSARGSPARRPLEPPAGAA